MIVSNKERGIKIKQVIIIIMVFMLCLGCTSKPVEIVKDIPESIPQTYIQQSDYNVDNQINELKIQIEELKNINKNIQCELNIIKNDITRLYSNAKIGKQIQGGC